MSRLIRAALRPPAIAAAALLLGLAACGEDSEPPASSAPGDRSGGGPAGGRETADDEPGAPTGERTDRPPPQPDGGDPAACVFEAPPGRLAQERVVVELDGIGCAQGRRLARAAALGQPAGANLTFDVGGFACEPSTLRKGENVRYSCAGEAGEASFDVVWTSG